jgi:hypothetical protein
MVAPLEGGAFMRVSESERGRVGVRAEWIGTTMGKEEKTFPDIGLIQPKGA